MTEGGASSVGLDMYSACKHAVCMAKALQIRNVPAGVHRRLKMRAAAAGMSLSELLLAEITRFAELPTAAEMQERLRSRRSTKLAESAAEAVRKERDSA